MPNSNSIVGCKLRCNLAKANNCRELTKVWNRSAPKQSVALSKDRAILDPLCTSHNNKAGHIWMMKLMELSGAHRDSAEEHVPWQQAGAGRSPYPSDCTALKDPL